MYASSLRVLIRIAIFGLILLATLVAALVIFLSQFELDDYRTSLEEKLAATLHQPVQIERISFTFNQGLALDLRNLRIGPADSVLVRLPHLTATLELLPLIEQQLQLREVQIDRPTINLRLPFPERTPRGTSRQLFDTLGISILTIHDASVQITQSIWADLPDVMNIHGLQAVLRDWQAGTRGHLVVTGSLDAFAAGFLIDAKLPTGLDPAVWRREAVRAHLEISGINPARLPRLPGRPLPEKLQLDVEVQGVPAEDAQWRARLQDAAGRDQLLALNGTWRSSPEQESLNGITGHFFRIPLQGETHYIRKSAEAILAGRVSAADLDLVPEVLDDWSVPGLQNLRSGRLERLSLVVDQRWQRDRGLSRLPRLALDLALTDLRWDAAQPLEVSEIATELVLHNGILQVQAGRLVTAGHPLQVSGRIDNLFREPLLNLQLETTGDSAELAALYNLPLDGAVSGPLQVRMSLGGTPAQPNFALSLDLDDTQWQWGDYFRKAASRPLQLSATGTLNNQTITARQLNLQIGATHINGSAGFHKDSGVRQMEISAAQIPLATLREFSPLLARHRLSGTLTATYRQQASTWNAELALSEVGAAVPGPVADLRQATGQVRLDPQGLHFASLDAVFGESRFNLTGILSSWQKPRFSLELSGSQIRARDLIFPDPNQVFEQIRGRLRFNRERLAFDDVQVTLDDQTRATVNGQVAFEQPRVDLMIAAEQVNVLDIIKLFRKDPSRLGGQSRRPAPRVRIEARADQGTLGGLRFTDATGIIDNRRGQLRIEPLSFRNGNGWCRGRVVFDRDQQRYPLTISAHLEDFDASVLHRDFFNRQGLLSGRLRGDFYLEGNPQPDSFWQTARGGIHVQVRDGTLRKFHGLAKVFSLLNVSQIFVGQLPDMDQDGMPFNLMDGSLRINDGRMHTEDLKINSEAMNLSLVGSQGLVDNTLDFTLGVMPLRTVDKVVTSIPLAGWVLGGEDKALLTAHFKIGGTSSKPQVTPIPIDSVSNTVLGIFQRTLSLPGKLVKDIGAVFKKEPEKKQDTTSE